MTGSTKLCDWKMVPFSNRALDQAHGGRQHNLNIPVTNNANAPMSLQYTEQPCQMGSGAASQIIGRNK